MVGLFINKFISILIKNLSLTIAIISLLIAVISVIFSIRSQRKANLISTGNLENSLRNSISNARRNMEERSLYYMKLIIEFRHEIMLEPDAKKMIHEAIEGASKTYASSVEDMLNAYENACGVYIDKKVDQKRFKEDYRQEVFNIVDVSENDDDITYKLIHSNQTKFNNIIKVYNKWKT